MGDRFLRIRLGLPELLLRSLSSWRFQAASALALLGLALVRVGQVDPAYWPLLVIGPYALVGATAAITMATRQGRAKQPAPLAPSLRRWLARRRLAALRGPLTRVGRVTALLFLLLALTGLLAIIVYSWRQATPADLLSVLLLLPTVVLAWGALIEALDKGLARLEEWVRRAREPSPGTPTRDIEEALSQILKTLDGLLGRGSELFQPRHQADEAQITRLLHQELTAFLPHYKRMMRHDFLTQNDELCRRLNNMLITLGDVLRDLRYLQGARLQYERAVTFSEAYLGPDDADTVQSRRMLASILEELTERR